MDNEESRNFYEYHYSKGSGVIRYARNHQSQGQTYLIPIREKRFQSFRLDTGLPVFINWKTHPFKDVEVLEWYERNMKAQDFYDTLNTAGICDTAATFVQNEEITHFVVKKEEKLSGCPGALLLYADADYKIITLPSLNH